MTTSKPLPTEPSKWLRRGAKGLIVVLSVYIIAQLGDYAWFRTQVPISFNNVNWSGNWKTQQYGLTGRLLVRLPTPLPENQDFHAEALAYYPIYSVWKTGQFVKMDFVGNFSPDTATTAGASENKIPNPGGKLKFKASAGNQVVEYVAIMDEMDESGSRIIGSYVSRSPSDIGYFFIQNY